MESAPLLSLRGADTEGVLPGEFKLFNRKLCFTVCVRDAGEKTTHLLLDLNTEGLARLAKVAQHVRTRAAPALPVKANLSAKCLDTLVCHRASGIMDALARLRDITRILREPGGCDWDRAQDLRSMRPHLVEEAYEVIDAIDRQDTEDLKEELGDVLFLVHFLARLAEEAGQFDIDQVAQTINEKLVRRHPHVFADTKVSGVADILKNWEAIKAAEKRSAADTKQNESATDKVAGSGTESTVGPGQSSADRDDSFASVLPKKEQSLPALFRASKIQEKVARVGFDWPTARGVLEKVREECQELVAEMEAGAPNDERVEAELGDLLFTLVNLARHLGHNPEISLNKATDRFSDRFRAMELSLHAQSRTVADSTPEELEAAWQNIKSREVRLP